MLLIKKFIPSHSYGNDSNLSTSDPGIFDLRKSLGVCNKEGNQTCGLEFIDITEV